MNCYSENEGAHREERAELQGQRQRDTFYLFTRRINNSSLRDGTIMKLLSSHHTALQCEQQTEVEIIEKCAEHFISTRSAKISNVEKNKMNNKNDLYEEN
jgi:hypothetical protein